MCLGYLWYVDKEIDNQVEMKILMVCLGNICRSPLAEAILQRKADEAELDWTVDSAGTNSYHIGEAPHHLSQKVASLNGLDISMQRARKFMAQDLEDYDIIYAMANDVLDDIRATARKDYNKEKLILFLDEMHPGQHRDVPDPWYGTEPGYHDVYALLEKSCDVIINKYKDNLHKQ